MSIEAGLNEDFLDLLEAFVRTQVEFLVVGAHAMAVHGVPRATGDLDVWVRPTTENAQRIVAALSTFGAPLAQHGVSVTDFQQSGTVYQVGLPPRRIDVLTSVSGLRFEEAWGERVTLELRGLPVPFLGRAALLVNKRAAGRDKDLVDLKLLEAAPPRR